MVELVVLLFLRIIGGLKIERPLAHGTAYGRFNDVVPRVESIAVPVDCPVCQLLLGDSAPILVGILDENRSSSIHHGGHKIGIVAWGIQKPRVLEAIQNV